MNQMILFVHLGIRVVLFENPAVDDSPTAVSSAVLASEMTEPGTIRRKPSPVGAVLEKVYRVIQS